MNTIDPLIWTPVVEDALTRLLTGLREHTGVMLAVGEPGSGKSMLARLMHQGLTDAGHRVGLVNVSSSFTAGDLHTLAATEWGLLSIPVLRVALLHDLQRTLNSQSRKGGRHILIFDDCDRLSDEEWLSDLRYLRGSGFPGTTSSGMVYCFGSPEFVKRYTAVFPVYRRLDEPVVLRPMTQAEAAQFIVDACRRQRRRPELVSPPAQEWLIQRSRGLPAGLALALDRVFSELLPHLPASSGPISVADVQRLLDRGGPIGADGRVPL